MDRPAKRQKLSNKIIADEAWKRRETRPRSRRALLPHKPGQSTTPTRTIRLDEFSRPSLSGERVSELRWRNADHAVLPRMPDVTVTAAAVEVIVNGGQVTSLVSAATSDLAVTIGTLGTLTVPAISADPTPQLSSASSLGLTSGSPSIVVAPTISSTIAIFPSSSLNRTATADLSSSSQKTATVTAISTLHVSYNGTFIIPTTQKSTNSSRYSRTITSHGSTFVTVGSYDSSTATYTFGESASLSGPYDAASSTSTGAGYIAGSTGTGTATTSTSSSTSSDTSPGLPPLTPKQTQMVGGIVGGFAGVALVLVLILFVLRWYRARLKSKGRLPDQLGMSHNLSSFGDTGLLTSSTSMAQASKPSLIPAALLGKWRSGSIFSDGTSAATTLTTNEKGFQRLSGRKNPSLFVRAGDRDESSRAATCPISSPFNRDSYPASHHLSASSFYPESIQTLDQHDHPPSPSEATTPVLASMLDPVSGRTQRPSLSEFATRYGKTSIQDFATSKDLLVASPRPFSPQMTRHLDGYAMMRDSPARTPVTESPNASSVRLPVTAPLTMDTDVPEMPLSPVGLGLGHDSQTNSASYRMSKRSGASTGGKFKEEI